MQSLVKNDYGFALVREGVSLDNALTTRPIVGVDWTVDTALIYRSDRYPKTLPAVTEMPGRVSHMVQLAGPEGTAMVMVNNDKKITAYKSSRWRRTTGTYKQSMGSVSRKENCNCVFRFHASIRTSRSKRSH
jgi:hypothetical protein